MKRIFIAPMTIAVFLSACTVTRPTMSYVAPGLSGDDAVTLATDAVEHLSGPFPPAKSTLLLDPPQNKAGDVLTPALLARLRANGFGVIEANPKTKAPAVTDTLIRYLVSPLENGVVLRLQYQGVEATRFYPRGTNGALLPFAPFTVREAAQ
jgi:hypothetical protein